MSERSGRADTVRDVKTTTVRLPDDLADQLAAEADRQGVSTSELVREGVILRLALAAAVRAGRIDILRALEKLLEGKRDAA
jgi:Arc/MetJ-type ribon-helix-helix transcriptional regulator